MNDVSWQTITYIKGSNIERDVSTVPEMFMKFMRLRPEIVCEKMLANRQNRVAATI